MPSGQRPSAAARSGSWRSSPRRSTRCPSGCTARSTTSRCSSTTSRPTTSIPDTLGLYEGIPLTERGSDYSGVLPDRITLFAMPIAAEAGPDDDALKRVIGETVVHEIAHHFGIDDERLHEIDRY